MRTLLFLLTIISLLFVLMLSISIYGNYAPNENRIFIKDIEPHNDGVYKYHAITSSGFRSFWFLDSANKFKVGDALILVKEE